MAAVLSTLLAAPVVLAQPYPARPVRIIVPYPPGGGIDAVARLVAAKLTEMWGQSVFVENRPGAGGAMGADLVAKSAPDGHTIVIISNSAVLATLAETRPPFDLFKDLTPVLLASRGPFLLVTSPKSGVQTLQGLLAFARTRPGGLNFASAGQGTITHLAMELLKQRTDIPVTHVPYKGISGTAVTDLIEGRVDALFASATGLMPYVRDKRLVALAVTSATRSPSAPGIPTMAEAGVARAEVAVWFGFLAPAGTPPAIVRKFHTDGATVLAMPDVVEKLHAQGQDASPLAPDAFGALLREEAATWGDLVRKANIKLD